jgi:hypothetical protein
LNEIGQLKVADIQESEGITFFRITNESRGQTLKNAESRRRVPVHPTSSSWDFSVTLRHSGAPNRSGYFQT